MKTLRKFLRLSFRFMLLGTFPGGATALGLGLFHVYLLRALAAGRGVTLETNHIIGRDGSILARRPDVQASEPGGAS